MAVLLVAMALATVFAVGVVTLEVTVVLTLVAAPVRSRRRIVQVAASRVDQGGRSGGISIGDGIVEARSN